MQHISSMVEDVLLEHNLGIMPVHIELLVLLVQTLQVVSADVFNAAIAFADIGKECWDVPAKIHEQIGSGKPAYHELIELVISVPLVWRQESIAHKCLGEDLAILIDGTVKDCGNIAHQDVIQNLLIPESQEADLCRKCPATHVLVIAGQERVVAERFEVDGKTKLTRDHLSERRLPCTDVSCNDQVHDAPLLPSTSRICPF